MATSTSTAAKPLPIADPAQQPYWDAAARHELALARCRACGAYVHPPGPGCTACGAAELAWVSLGSAVHGRVHSFVVVHRAFHAGFAAEVPYVVALCEVIEAPGARVTANILGVDPDAVNIGMDVQMSWEERDGVTLPQWTPTIAPAAAPQRNGAR